MVEELKNDEYDLDGIFRKKIFEVPNYQRYFSWNRRPHLKDLWNDLENITGEENLEHYMGTIICRKKDNSPLGEDGIKFHRYDIVDGQQRLTALAILTNILIEKYLEIYERTDYENEREKRDIEVDKEKFVKHPDIPLKEGINDNKFKLRLQGGDGEVFKELLDGRDPRNVDTPSKERLERAFEFFENRIENKISKLSEEDSIEILEVFLRAIKNLTFMVYSIESMEEATLIFESINDRGLGLSNLDKIKGFLSHKLYVVLQDEEKWQTEVGKIQDQFSQIYSDMQRIEFSDVIRNIDEKQIHRYHFIAYMPNSKLEQYHDYANSSKKTRKKAASGDEYLEAIKWWFGSSQFEGPDECVEEIGKYVESLKHFFSNLRDMVEVNDPSLRRKLDNLFILEKIANFYPILLSVWDKYEREGNIDSEDLEDFLELIEIAAFRAYAVGNRRSDTGRNKLYRYAHDFYNEEINLGELREKIKDGIISNYEDDGDFESDLEKVKFYEKTTLRDIRYLLYFFNKKRVENKRTAQMDHTLKKVVRNSENNYTIDHTMPQNLDNLGLNEEEIDYWGGKDPHKHQVGNLTLATKSKNSKYQDEHPSTKMENEDYYPDSDFRITREAKTEYYDKYGEWREAMEKRTEDIVNFAKEWWAIPE